MKAIFLAAFALGSALGVIGQDVARTVSTSLDNSRFEVIQSPLEKDVTFRLDKYNGTIDRLTTCPKDDGYGSNRCWKEMFIFELPKGQTAVRPRYQIIINGPLKLTMLMQIDTGRSWQFGLDPEERWYPFVECTQRSNNNCIWRP